MNVMYCWVSCLQYKHQPVKNFTVIPQSATRVNVIYRNVYCLNVDLQPHGLVAVRDGAYSAFDTSRLIDEFIPIQGLKVNVCHCLEYANDWRTTDSSH